jgi:general stress protein YciG
MSEVKKGFAAMPAEQHRAIASLGGKALRPEQRSFSFDPELAREAGRKGGKAMRPENRTFAKNPELARIAGRKGGAVSGKRK